LNLQIGARSVDVERVWQVMRADKNIAARDRHVFGQLALDS
jgi:hypothetical protein